MSSYPMEVYSTPDQEGIPMDSGSNYENSSIPAEGFADRNQRYRKNEGWEEGTRESSHRPNPPNGDTDEFFNLPSRQKSMKPGATWRMKSRKGRKSFATIRLRHGEKFDNDDIADVIINNTGGTDNVDTAKETMEEIRELPKNMSDKKAIRDKVERRCSSKKEERSPNCLVLFYYRMSMNWQSLKGKVAEVLYSLELWKASLKTIEGNFGTGVTSYFEFLKWLFLFNIPTFLIILFFVVVPQLLWRIKGNNLAVYMASDTSFTGIELLSGGGWFKGTELFYGSYTNYTVEIIIGTKYSMRFAYLFTCGGFYVITLLTLAYSLVKSYKIHFIEGSQSNRLYYVSKVLCGWDYMVTQEDSKNLHRKTLTKELQEYLAEFREEKHTKTCGEWCRLVLLRLLINIAVLGVLAGFGYLIWYIAPLTRSATSSNAILRDITTPLVISAINLIVPFAFSYLASIENYHNPWVDIFLTMLRTITLNVVTLGALMSFWFISSDISCHSQLQTTTNTTESNTVSPVETTSSDTTTEATSSDNECIPCWENFLGQQFYCLVIVDFIFIILATFCSEFLKKILAASKKVSHPEFNIGRNTLNLIYSQSLVWLGVFYCPLLPFIMILKLFILFYIKKVSVVYNCQPSERSWRGGRTYTVILLLLFIAFQLCFLSVSYSVVFMSSSQDCGPFISYNTSYAVISEAVDDWKERNNSGFIKGLVEILTSAAFYITIFMIVCAIAYYTRLVSKGRKEIVERLRKQIQMEGKDKNFLKKVAQHVRNGANVKGTRHRATQPPVETLNPQPNGGIAGGRDNNNDPRDSYESPTRVPPETYDNDYFRASQEAPVDVMNPGYRENSPTTRPNLPYSTGQQYAAGL